MFHPVGEQPASTYWRRRLILLAVAALLLFTLYYVLFASNGGSQGASTTSPSPTGSTASTGGSQSGSSNASSSTQASEQPTIAPCAQQALSIVAGSQAATYPVTAQPVLYLQVTNTAAVPCSVDLADAQIELLVYNGASRVWGSHDCKVLPGTSVQTLAPNTPITRSITWSGLSSQPACVGTRQHVTPGTFTVQGKLAGVAGSQATFSLT